MAEREHRTTLTLTDEQLRHMRDALGLYEQAANAFGPRFAARPGPIEYRDHARILGEIIELRGHMDYCQRYLRHVVRERLPGPPLRELTGLPDRSDFRLAEYEQTPTVWPESPAHRTDFEQDQQG